MNPPVLIVDGYNIIGAWEELKELKRRELGSARDQLITLLSAYQPWCWQRIIIVFDGQYYDWEYLDGVEVVFTEGSETADTMIEKLAGGLSTYYKVEVATSDSSVFRAASALGARVFSAATFKEILEEHRQSYRHRLANSSSNKGLMLNDLLSKSILDNLKRLRSS